MRRVSVGAHEFTTTLNEEVGDLDDIALDATGDRGDLADTAGAVTLERRVDDDVDRTSDGRDDEATADVLAAYLDVVRRLGL